MADSRGGHAEPWADGTALPCTTYDRLAEIDQGGTVEHKRPGHVPAIAAQVQAQRDNWHQAGLRERRRVSRRDRSPAMLHMARQLFSQAQVAIDGSKFRAVNTRDCNFIAGKVDKRPQQIEESIQRYLSALETADRTQPAEIEFQTTRLRG